MEKDKRSLVLAPVGLQQSANHSPATHRRGDALGVTIADRHTPVSFPSMFARSNARATSLERCVRCRLFNVPCGASPRPVITATRTWAIRVAEVWFARGDAAPALRTAKDADEPRANWRCAARGAA
jgi:hypothetical protein